MSDKTMTFDDVLAKLRALLYTEDQGMDREMECYNEGIGSAIKIFKDNRAAIEASLLAGGQRLSLADVDLIVEHIQEWLTNQTNAHGIMIPADDWDGYDVAGLRKFFKDLEAGGRGVLNITLTLVDGWWEACADLRPLIDDPVFIDSCRDKQHIKDYCLQATERLNLTAVFVGDGEDEDAR